MAATDSETIFEVLARQFELAKLNEAKDGALIQVVDPGIPPDEKSFPQRGLIVIGSTAFRLIVGIFAAFLQAATWRWKGDSETALKLHLLRDALALTR